MWFSWIFAGFWNLISLPLLLLIPGELSEKENYAALVGLLFPLVGTFLLWWAVKTTLRQRKFGVSELEMITLPGVVGGSLRGAVHSGLHQAPAGGVQVTLSSIHRVERRGENRSARERILWQEDYILPPRQLQAGPRGLAFPVEFSIPYDSRQTDDSDAQSEIIWRLETQATVSGVDYYAQFEVPVFKTSASALKAHGESQLAKEDSLSAQQFDPASQ